MLRSGGMWVLYYITSSAGREIAKMRLGNVVQKVGRACSYLSTAAVYHPAHNIESQAAGWASGYIWRADPVRARLYSRSTVWWNNNQLKNYPQPPVYFSRFDSWSSLWFLFEVNIRQAKVMLIFIRTFDLPHSWAKTMQVFGWCENISNLLRQQQKGTLS